MVTVTSLAEYKQVQKTRIAKLKSLKRRGPITSAKFMAFQLRSMCPRGAGSHPSYPHMYQTIRRSKNKVFLGGVNRDNGFPYVHWVNATPGTDLEYVNLFNKGKLWSYAQTNHTGVPGFYWIAQARAREFGRDAMLTATRNILSSEF
jgi:hypothetical protein